MTKKPHEIIFLNRAYNDLDIQFSLIDAFAQNKNFNVRVIGYPCDGDMGSPLAHEATQYMNNTHKNITFETVLDHAPAPLHLRLIYKLERALLKIKSHTDDANIVIRLSIKFMHVSLLILMRHLLKGDLPWLDRVAQKWDPCCIVMDEAFVQQGRSYMVDKILSDLASKDVPIHVIQTGQTTYPDPLPNKSAPTQEKAKKILPRSAAKRFFVPSTLDQSAIKSNFPQEVTEIHGNLRMDIDWITKLHQEILVPPYMNKPYYMDKLPHGKGPRVVCMLSKLGYGIKLEELKDSIRAVANMPGVQCAIKPHTRGMKFDFMSQDELADSVIVPEVPSALLIEWADIILFTGSSIAFHAMILDKRVGFLQNCQYLETTFDDGSACYKFDHLDELTTFLQDWRDNGEPEIDDKTRALRQSWLTDNVHGGLKSGLIAKHYKNCILKTLNIE